MSGSLLDWLSASNAIQNPGLTPSQAQVDGMVEGFVHHATDLRSIAAMTAGGMAYRLGRVGVMSSSVRVQNFEPLRAAVSIGLGLTAEVSAFELTSRGLHSVGANLVFARNGIRDGRTQGSPLQEDRSNLWRWNGMGGLKQGLLSSLVTFGTLKGFGKLAEGQNLILQHGAQDLAMVLGHQLLYKTGLGERPEGTLAEQILHAEATNLQIGAGMALGHAFTGGGLQALERGLDLSLQSRELKLAPSLKIKQLSEDPVRREYAQKIAALFSGEIPGKGMDDGGKLNALAAPGLLGIDMFANGHPTGTGLLLTGLAILASTSGIGGVFSRGAQFLKSLFLEKKEKVDPSEPKKKGATYRTAPERPPFGETRVEDGWSRGEKVRIFAAEGEEEAPWGIVTFNEIKEPSRQVQLIMARGPLPDVDVSKRMEVSLVACKFTLPLEEAQRIGLVQIEKDGSVSLDPRKEFHLEKIQNPPPLLPVGYRTPLASPYQEVQDSAGRTFRIYPAGEEPLSALEEGTGSYYQILITGRERSLYKKKWLAVIPAGKKIVDEMIELSLVPDTSTKAPFRILRIKMTEREAIRKKLLVVGEEGSLQVNPELARVFAEEGSFR